MTVSYLAYIRVSTLAQAQNGNLDDQRAHILTYAKQSGLTIFGFFQDIASGSHKARPNLDSLLAFLEHNPGQYGFICTKLNRLSRLNVTETMDLVFKLRRLTADTIIFVDEPLIAFKTEENVGQTYLMLKALLSAEWRDEHSRNVKRGIARARAQGQSWGRKKKEINLKQYHQLKQAGASLTVIAKFFGMSRPTLLKRLKEAHVYDPSPYPFPPRSKKSSTSDLPSSPASLPEESRD